MPQKVRKSNLGRSLVKDRFKGVQRRGDESARHTAELGDGYDWNNINLRSVTEETSIDEFLNTAQLAGTEFVAEKLNITFVNPRGQIGLPTADERRRIEAAQLENQDLLQIPRRPAWDEDTSPGELHAAEEESFLAWRRQLAQLQEQKGLILTPYERNLQFWRQLWRVIERSDVIIQIVDARNPLLFRCEDLERYVKEVDPEKENMILVNKSDFLTEWQRAVWADHFNQNNIKAVFFSALNETDAKPLASGEQTADEVEKPDSDSDSAREGDSDGEAGDSGEDVEHVSETLCPGLTSWPEPSSVSDTDTSPQTDSGPGDPQVSTRPPSLTGPSGVSDIDTFPQTDSGSGVPGDRDPAGEVTVQSGGRFTTPRLLSRTELIHLLKHVHRGRRYTQATPTVGFVGYPNVGKSSTINALLQTKKVSVSATPGKTKHFQTLYIDPGLLLCDCPGLVMPSFLSTKAEMVIWGVLPIDEMRDHVPPVNHVAHLIPRHVLERTYGLMLPPPREGEQPDRPPTAEELLNAYGYMRGYMTSRGMPDNPRSARVILKDFVRGKLLYCMAPPGNDQGQFHSWLLEAPPDRPPDRRPPQEKVVKPSQVSAEALDRSFFSSVQSRAHSRDVRGVQRTDGVPPGGSSEEMLSDRADIVTSQKPWRVKGATKRPKRDKLRRTYRHLDDV